MPVSLPVAHFAEHPSQDAARLLTLVAGLRACPCVACNRLICGHEAVFNIALGCQNAARCLPCLAAAMEQSPPRLRDQLFEHVRRRDCYNSVWTAESQREFPASDGLPTCLWPVGSQLTESIADVESSPTKTRSAQVSVDESAAALPREELVVATRWDAGDLACGDLVLQLRGRLRELSPGSVLELVAVDPGAPSDIPAWCGLTGHSLVRHNPPFFWIRRKEN